MTEIGERHYTSEFSEEECETIARFLYDGGWLSSDKEELKQEYQLSDWEVEAICKGLKEYEFQSGRWCNEEDD